MAIKHLDHDGRYIEGNKPGNASPVKVKDLAYLMLKAVTPEHVKGIMDAMYKLAVSDPDSRVKLAAQVEYLNRVFGKPGQQVTMDINRTTNTTPVRDLTPEEEILLEKIIGKCIENTTKDCIIEAEVIDSEKDKSTIE